jgi:sulfonate transport system substrate-binding protein
MSSLLDNTEGASDNAPALHQAEVQPRMFPSLRSRPISQTLKLALLLGAGLACGCNAKSAGSDPASGAGPSASAATRGYEPVTIRFSDPQNQGVLAYAKREHILEKELAKVGAAIEWVPAAGAFSANFEAMNSGAINASAGAISPIIGALSHNLNFKIFAIADPGGVRQAGIISPANSSVREVKDLVGKRVAVNLAAHGDYILLKALANDAVPADKVNRLPIQPPDAAAAFATGKIDAWSTFGVFYSTAIRNGAHVLVSEEDIHSDDVGILAANAAVLAKNPAAFQVLLKVTQDLTEQAHAHPEQFQNVFVDKGPTAVSGPELDTATAETRVLPAYRVPTAGDKVRIENVSKIFYDNHSIDRPIAVDQIAFDIDEAAKAKGTAP